MHLRHVHLPSLAPHYISYDIALRVHDTVRRQHIEYRKLVAEKKGKTEEQLDKEDKGGKGGFRASVLKHGATKDRLKYPPPPTLISFTLHPTFFVYKPKKETVRKGGSVPEKRVSGIEKNPSSLRDDKDENVEDDVEEDVEVHNEETVAKDQATNNGRDNEQTRDYDSLKRRLRIRWPAVPGVLQSKEIKLAERQSKALDWTYTPDVLAVDHPRKQRYSGPGQLVIWVVLDPTIHKLMDESLVTNHRRDAKTQPEDEDLEKQSDANTLADRKLWMKNSIQAVTKIFLLRLYGVRTEDGVRLLPSNNKPGLCIATVDSDIHENITKFGVTINLADTLEGGEAWGDGWPDSPHLYENVSLHTEQRGKLVRAENPWKRLAPFGTDPFAVTSIRAESPSLTDPRSKSTLYTSTAARGLCSWHATYAPIDNASMNNLEDLSARDDFESEAAQAEVRDSAAYHVIEGWKLPPTRPPPLTGPGSSGPFVYSFEMEYYKVEEGSGRLNQELVALPFGIESWKSAVAWANLFSRRLQLEDTIQHLIGSERKHNPWCVVERAPEVSSNFTYYPTVPPTKPDVITRGDYIKPRTGRLSLKTLRPLKVDFDEFVQSVDKSATHGVWPATKAVNWHQLRFDVEGCLAASIAGRKWDFRSKNEEWKAQQMEEGHMVMISHEPKLRGAPQYQGDDQTSGSNHWEYGQDDGRSYTPQTPYWQSSYPPRGDNNRVRSYSTWPRQFNGNSDRRDDDDDDNNNNNNNRPRSEDGGSYQQRDNGSSQGRPSGDHGGYKPRTPYTPREQDGGGGYKPRQYRPPTPYGEQNGVKRSKPYKPYKPRGPYVPKPRTPYEEQNGQRPYAPREQNGDREYKPRTPYVPKPRTPYEEQNGQRPYVPREQNGDREYKPRTPYEEQNGDREYKPRTPYVPREQNGQRPYTPRRQNGSREYKPQATYQQQNGGREFKPQMAFVRREQDGDSMEMNFRAFDQRGPRAQSSAPREQRDGGSSGSRPYGERNSYTPRTTGSTPYSKKPRRNFDAKSRPKD